MKHKVRRKGTEQAHQILSKGGLNHTESNEYRNWKDRSDAKLELSEVTLSSVKEELDDERD
jgi:hypothetical protein